MVSDHIQRAARASELFARIQTDPRLSRRALGSARDLLNRVRNCDDQRALIQLQQLAATAPKETHHDR